MRINILLLEDDAEFAAGVVAALRREGCTVEHLLDGKSGLARAMQQLHEVLIVDRMLPGLDGLSVVRQLRQHSIATPVLFLTTLGGIEDRVQGLDAGGDDYLVKPFAFPELLARLRVLQRRGSSPVTSLAIGTVQMDLLQRQVTREGKSVALLPQEFLLLEYLMRNCGRVVTRSMILEHVWKINFDPLTSVVESHISRLRTKLNRDGGVDLIQTVRGVGYRFRAS